MIGGERMKINNINNKYINYNNGNTKPLKNEEPVKNSKNYDVIEIRKNKANEVNSINNSKLNNIDEIKKDILDEINKETSTEKINRIKEQIKNNVYNLDVDKIVNKLLD
jgi:anti-sigma28 factor (negative regulator of flagellin synthesis)